ncbi:hypothetical protein SOASR030_08540 [Leminorella grimontii]|uniref:Uncharacterized protein n=1 Tax=Leminorella grimontii TaxID=82981 RepID=A0AAV5MZ40_9GAMM|nr:hypothetical protein SOASR030_08540 [Leminorella grimontii]
MGGFKRGYCMTLSWYYNTKFYKQNGPVNIPGRLNYIIATAPQSRSLLKPYGTAQNRWFRRSRKSYTARIPSP